MSLAATVRAMEQAGCTAKQIADVVIAHVAEEEGRRDERRAKDAARKRKQRHAESLDVTRTERDIAGQAVTETSPYTEDAPTYAEPEPNITTRSPVQKDILTDIPKVPVAKPVDGFDEAWAIYPRRQGGNSRKNAEASFRKALKAGVSAATIIDGIRAYAEHCDATGKTGTEFVKTAEAWLNGRFWESDWSVSLSRAPPPRQANNRRSLSDAIDRMFPDEPTQPAYPRLAFGG
jgi:hypothetical protein